MLLEAKGLFKAFHETVVLNDISFTISPGEIVSLVGKSGAGKTTVLRLITGLEKCDKGTIAIDGKYICQYTGEEMKYASKNELYEIRKRLGLVFQSYHLFPHKTVLGNVMMALTDVYKMPMEEAMTKAVAMLKSLGLEEKLNNMPFELSGGQKQRVAIARSCVINPKLLCFDEPTAALDSALITSIITIIKSFAEKGMGILIISHDEKFVQDVSDRVLHMRAGKIVAETKKEEYALSQ